MQELARRFVPVAEEVHRLQRGKDLECRLFQEFAEHGHYKGRVEPSDTRQGIYAVTPAGAFLASCNTRQPEAVRDMLERALAAFEQTASTQCELDDGSTAELRSAQARRDAAAPEGGLVLAVYARDLPRGTERPGAARGDWRAHAWNRDFAWLTAEQVQELAPRRAEGAPAQIVDPRLVRHVARHWFVDHVRGQTTPYADGAVEHATLSAEVVRRDGDRSELRLVGETRTRQRGRWLVGGLRATEPTEQERGVDVRIEGRAVWDETGQRFVELELVALGERWGGTRYNGREDDFGRSPIGFAVVISDEKRVAPALR